MAIFLALAYSRGIGHRAPKLVPEKSPFEAIFQLHQTFNMIYNDYRNLYWYLIALILFANSVTAFGKIFQFFLKDVEYSLKKIHAEKFFSCTLFNKLLLVPHL